MMNFTDFQIQQPVAAMTFLREVMGSAIDIDVALTLINDANVQFNIACDGTPSIRLPTQMKSVFIFERTGEFSGVWYQRLD